jgi:hypothetical protein
LTLVMTEDAGPPGPAERFSSLPIRKADATAAGTDGSELIIRCDMSQAFGTGVRSAQAFEIPRKPDGRQRMRCHRSRSPGFPEHWLPDKLSGSLPSWPDPVRIVSWEYGSVFGLTQARQTSPEAPGSGADSCPGDPAKVKQFWRI